MYRACRLSASASRAFRESPHRPDDRFLRKTYAGKFDSSRADSTFVARSTVSILKVAGSFILATGATIGGAIFYAGRDEKIRDDFESKIPYSENVLTAIYGAKNAKKKDDDKDLESLLPIYKKADKEVSQEKSLDSEKTTLGTSNLSNQSESAAKLQDRDERPLRTDNVVVITTIDDQAAVSSVDLDIGNPPLSKEKRTKKKQKKPKPEKQVEQKETKSEPEKPDQPVKQEVPVASMDKTIATAAGLGATEKTSEEQVAKPISQINAEEIVSEKDLTKEEIESISEFVDKSAMEVLIQAYVDKLQLLKDMALEKQEKASEQVREYVTLLSKALETEANNGQFDEVWKAASDLEHHSQASIDDAKDFEMKMQAGIEAVHEMIKATRKSGVSEVADKAQEFINQSSIDLQKSAENVKKACEELVSFDKFHGTVKAAKDRIQDEIKENLPELLEKSQDGTEEQVAMKDVLVAYAMRKVDFFKKEIENIKQEERERTESLLKMQRDEEEKRMEVRLHNEAERMHHEFEIQSEKKEAELSSHYENEIKKQLKRQSAAHREHLNDVLQVQAAQLSSEHQQNLDKAMSNLKQIHVDELARVSAHLNGVESMIDSVVDVEKANRKIRELWLAVQSFNSVLNEEVSQGRTRNLMPEITSIHKLAGEHPTIQLVLSTIPETAAVQGVSTEAELKKRFSKVKNICKRVAMVGDKRGSLWTYALSASRSFLVLETAAKHDVSSEIDIDTVSTYDILAKAQKCIEDGEFELAVKFMSLLRGVPRKLASDWLQESKAYLETKLASDFLLAYVASQSAFQN